MGAGLRFNEGAHRVVNGCRKILAGLRPFGESVWPGVRNDLFVAHEAIYRFFCAYAHGRAILDAGCGTGYGSFLLAEAGAADVVGVDIDGLSIAYARRHYRRDHLRFEIGDIESLPYDHQMFDVVVASNSVEHLDRPEEFLGKLRQILEPGGVALLAIPPIYSDADLDVHRHIHYHRNQLFVNEWLLLFEKYSFRQEYFAHRLASADLHVDFGSHQTTRLSHESFKIERVSREEFLNVPSISAIVELRM